MDDIKYTIKSYILDEFLPGENPSFLNDDTPLISGGVLDSIATLKLGLFLEETFHIKLERQEVTIDYLDNLTSITELVETKIKHLKE